MALFEVDTQTRIVKLSEHWSQMLGGAAIATVTTMPELMLLTHPTTDPPFAAPIAMPCAAPVVVTWLTTACVI